MKTKKSPKKVSKKLKLSTLYNHSPEVKKEEIKLKKLQKERKNVEKEIEQIISTFNSKSISHRESEQFLEVLPLNTLTELQNYINGKEKDFNLEIMQSRTDLRRNREKKTAEINQLDNQIYQTQIDAVLAKLNYTLSDEFVKNIGKSKKI